MRFLGRVSLHDVGEDDQQVSHRHALEAGYQSSVLAGPVLLDTGLRQA
eukprot:CAMPEP_0176268682 /NCGR_PEP_ID=MMETSP0121_2-20121125/43801_1 /TAXON_ID=160619 /ORGANISM="Kryptoperidinium foliaceum, Strain CCMP 1326" /LENGTH=47 /DNA_ID= /DNA_START= /DNA_END= /DNA_ORIENTATION=